MSDERKRCCCYQSHQTEKRRVPTGCTRACRLTPIKCSPPFVVPRAAVPRLFAPSPSPIFTPPALTSRERDTLNASPLGFVSSRPSSPGSTLSGYFSALPGPSPSRNTPTSAHASTLQKPRFVNASPSSRYHNAYDSSTLKSSASVASIMMKKRPRSRADGRPSSISRFDDRNKQSQNLAYDIIRATTPHSTGATNLARQQSSFASSSPLRPSTSTSTLNSLSRASSSFADFMGISYQSPPHKAASVSSSPQFTMESSSIMTDNSSSSSPIFAFSDQSTHSQLGSMIRNTSTIQDQQSNGLRNWHKSKLKKVKTTKPAYSTICGKATVNANWRLQMAQNARTGIEDNKGWSNKMDAFEKRLEAKDRETRNYLKKKQLSQFNTYFQIDDIQADKRNSCIRIRNFFGKSAQGTFNIDEEKPYLHTFRDWERMPIFHN